MPMRRARIPGARPRARPATIAVIIPAAALVLAMLMAALLAGCGTPNYHMMALSSYRAGDFAEAESTLAPLLLEESKNMVLYMWDMGMIRFAQGNYLGANQVWMSSDALAGIEPGTAKTTGELWTADSDKDYLGDPVEHSLASLYVGLGFYMSRDYQNALVAFKKCLEWDFNEDPELQGNMVITNHMMGECYSVLGESDNAVVGFRRAITENPDFVPSYVGVIRELEKMNNMDEAARYRGELSALAPDSYIEAIAEHPQGILAIIMAGAPPPIEEVADAFRKRKEISLSPNTWYVMSHEVYSVYEHDRPGHFTLDSTLHASLADQSLTHFQDQGGEMGQVTRKLVQQGLSALTEGLFGFGTDASADMRYWSTPPGEIYAMYLPLAPGLHTIQTKTYDHAMSSLPEYRQIWHYIPVEEDRTTALVLQDRMNFPDADKIEKAPPPLACCDATGHNPEFVPFILGGRCYCTPSGSIVDAMHAAGHHKDVDYKKLDRMYKDAGIVTNFDHRGCNNLCVYGPHVAFGGKCMASPTPGTRNYENVLSWTPVDEDSLQTSEASIEE